MFGFLNVETLYFAVVLFASSELLSFVYIFVCGLLLFAMETEKYESHVLDWNPSWVVKETEDHWF